MCKSVPNKKYVNKEKVANFSDTKFYEARASSVLLNLLVISTTTLNYGPSDWSRTSGLLNPIQARYQTAPHPEIHYNNIIHHETIYVKDFFYFLGLL